ncbi:MAG TPA: phosphatase PAP2 family protein, partial [Actinomycetota bacterium]|nr:phosphatase PAP2 family protein [Actinomycetota bacterium]
MPRKLGVSGKISIVLIVYTLVVTGLWGAIPAFEGVAERINTAVQSPVVAVRTPWLTQLARWIDVGGASWGMTSLALLTLILLMVFRRWRHLLVFLGAITVMEIVGEIIYKASSRPRPFGINDIGSWGGYSLPSPPTAFLAATLIGIAYTLVVPGRPRFAAKLAAAGILVVFGLARLYLGIDHPSDVVFGLVLGVAFPLIAFRTFVPNEVFPVVYRRGNRAHLDVGGRRGQAIRQAVRDQLGLTVAEVKPVGLAGSGGSTPLRLLLEREDGSRGVAFAKLYAKNHVRADRWYKLWRTILYGALEDEASFQSVRRFVQFEDYTLRLLRDAGIPTAAPMGIVEITPGREYMLVTEFLEGATEIGDPAVTVDEHIVDEGLQLVRRLWDAGLAHRDIKPANLMVRDGTLYLIDAFFVQVRPSPWREAVDLANMMLVLAVRSDPDLVYQRALAFFSPDELAEAFAAARGVASPTQLRVALKKDGRDLVARFRSLAPQRRPIRIQRWSVKRVGLAAGVL